MNDFNRRKYREFWQDLNHELDNIAVGGLSRALDALHHQQMDQGFIRDDLQAVKRYKFSDQQARHHFTAQFNPRRAERFNGAGRHHPPNGSETINDGCFLCPHNIQWQQRGIEMGYELEVRDQRYIAWMNPYPLLPNHVVIATQEHIPQSWIKNGHGGQHRDFSSITRDLINIASRLPGWIGFYNGENAGASIPHHLHFQFFKRPAHYNLFPLEQAVADGEHSYTVVRNRYPLNFAYWQGSARQASTQALPWLESLVAQQVERGMHTANVIAVAEEDGAKMHLYFVPRDSTRSRSPLMSGLVGGLEILGELIFSTDEEQRRLEQGQIDYSTVEQVLASVAVEV